VTITDLRMTRFWLSLDHAVDFVMLAIDEMRGGEIFIPKIPSMRITDLARAMAPRAQLKEIGIRPGEKIHEILLTAEEARTAREFGTYFVVAPSSDESEGSPVPEGFVYASDTNTQWLTAERLAELVEEMEGGGG
jgi:UDP-N-acetylglucosamine 4,6-dehydratase